MPDPLSALGRVLTRIREKVEDVIYVSPERDALRARVAALKLQAAALELPGMKAALGEGLDSIARQETGLDGVDEGAARTGQLAQLVSATDAIEARLAQLDAAEQDRVQLISALQAARQVLTGLAAGAEHDRLDGKLATLERGRGIALASANTKDLDALKALGAAARAAREEAARALVAQRTEESRVAVAAARQALQLRTTAAQAFDSSSPTMKLRQKTLADLLAELDRVGLAGEHMKAEDQLPALRRALDEAEAQEAVEAKAYTDALKAATDQHAALAQPVVAPDAAKFKTDFLDAAAALAAAKDRQGATTLLAGATLEHDRIAAEAQDYADQLAAAKARLTLAKPKMVALDIEKVEKEMIAEAEKQAGIGARASALALLAEVEPHCKLSEKANLKGFTSQGLGTDVYIGPLEQLRAHAQAGEFASEIMVLERRVDRTRSNVAAGMTTRKADPKDGSKTLDSFADKELSAIYWATMALLTLANQHAAYAIRRDACTLKIKQLREAEPLASNVVITAQLAALQSGMEKAERQAKKRTCDLAEATLKQMDADAGTALKLKQAHATYTAELKLLEPRVTAAVDEAGKPSAATAAALRALLARAKALADGAKDHAGANVLLAELKLACDAADKLAKQATEDQAAATKALATTGSDPAGALAEVRRLFEALKTRPGHAGIPADLSAIEGLLGQAATALKD